MILLSILGQIDLYFGDETSFSLRPCVPYGWLPKGKQTDIITDRQLVLNVFGLLNTNNQHLKSYMNKQTVDSEYMIRCLDDFAQQLNRPTVIVLDQASYHRSELFKAQLDRWQQQNLYVFYLPPYSPHLNPIEILWRFIKYQWLKPQHYLNKHTLREAIEYILQNYAGIYHINWTKNTNLIT